MKRNNFFADTRFNTFVIEIIREKPGAKTVRVLCNNLIEEYEYKDENRRIIGTILSNDFRIKDFISTKIKKKDKKNYKVLDNSYNEKGIRLKVSGEIKDYIKFFTELGCKCSYKNRLGIVTFTIRKGENYDN